MTDIVAIARYLAARNPGVRLPCPVCTSSVNAENLDAHLTKQHASASGPTVLRGKEGRIFWVGLIAVVLVAIAGAAINAVKPLATGSPAVIALVLAGFVPGMIALLGLANVFPAQLVLGDDTVTLRHAFGLVRRVARLPSAVEAGGMLGYVTSPGGQQGDYNVPGEEIKAGSYLRIAGPSSILVGCPSNAGTKAHWTGWTQGPHRRFADITVPRAAMIALEYHLAARGVLTIGSRSAPDCSRDLAKIWHDEEPAVSCQR